MQYLIRKTALFQFDDSMFAPSMSMATSSLVLDVIHPNSDGPNPSIHKIRSPSAKMTILSRLDGGIFASLNSFFNDFVTPRPAGRK